MNNIFGIGFVFTCVSTITASFSVRGNPQEFSYLLSPHRTVEPSVYDQSKKSDFYETHFKDEMPIFGYVSMPKANAYEGAGSGVNPSFIHQDVYELYKAAGFNVVCPTYQRETNESIDVHREIEVCNELGLKYLIRDTNFLCNAKDADTVTKEYCLNKFETEKQWYLSQPNVIGIQTSDEPNLDDFSVMGEFYKALYEYDSTRWAFSTLFPVGASAKQLHTEELEKTMSHWEAYKLYVRDYIEKTNSAYVLYDQYTNISARTIYTYENTVSYMRSLSYFANIAREYGIRFMTAIASYRHAGKYEMTPEEIYRATNLQLAYGSKGIEYYTYWPTIGSISSMTAWENPSLMGLVTTNGIPHDTYYHVKANNENIRAVQKYLIPAVWKGIKYFGQKNVYIESGDFYTDPSDAISDITGGEAFVGVFDYQGKTIYYIVNSTVTSGLKSYVVKLNGKHKAHIVNSKVEKTKENTYSIGFALSAGEAILLEID